MSDNNNYNYAIEKHLAQFGGEADKNITRTCGNCCAYDSVIAICNRDDEPENTIEATEQGCWYHKTHDEQKRLEELVKQRQDETNRRHLVEQRKTGTGECAGCPFREMRDMLQKVIGLDVLAGYWDTKNNCSLRESIEKLLAKARGEE